MKAPHQTSYSTLALQKAFQKASSSTVVEQKEHIPVLVLYIFDKMVLLQMLGISLIEAAAC